jgi:hypothetical protein
MMLFELDFERLVKHVDKGTIGMPYKFLRKGEQ